MCVGEVIEVTLTVKGVKRTFLVRVTRCKRAGLRVFDVAGEFITAEEATSTPAKDEKGEKGKRSG